jgi:cytochrome b6-f complex iron-sulfur subunit
MSDEPKPTDITATPPSAPPANVTATPPAAPPPAAAAPSAAPPKAPVKAADAGRRGFLLTSVAGIFGSWFAIAWLALGASVVGFLLGTVRFLFPNVLSEPPSKFKVGEKAVFEDGKVNERFKDQGTWIVRYQGIIYALSTTCTHLGCTPNWLEAEQKFKCPCHGSGFKITGVNFEGPAPRPLERYALSIGDDGQLVVDKAKKFQKELGQWTNPESFVKA